MVVFSWGIWGKLPKPSVTWTSCESSLGISIENSGKVGHSEELSLDKRVNTGGEAESVFIKCCCPFGSSQKDGPDQSGGTQRSHVERF